MNLDKSKELYREAVRLMPGGVNSPVRAFKSVGGSPVFMQQGRGSRLYDVDGNEYIDYCMSWGPMILGHADADVTAAVVEAAQNGTSFGTPNASEVAIARMVTDRFPSIEKVRFVNSGTEAVMSAIRLARGFAGKDKIIKFDGCYHGHGDYMLVAGGSGLATFGTPDSAGVTRDNVKDTLVVPFNDISSLEKAVDMNRNSLAAVIMEPLPCNSGLVLPEEGYLRDVRSLCDDAGILLIFDEVISGFRLSRGGAQEYYGIRPDITTLGKIIGGGLPVGAYGASEKIMKMIAPDGPVYQAGTLSGNPLAMAAGIATLEKLDSADVYGKLSQKQGLMHDLLVPVLSAFEGKVLFVQCESIFGIYFTGQKALGSVDHVHACDMKTFGLFHAEMLERGVYLSPSGYEVGFLCAAHTEEDIRKTVQAIDESLRVVLKQ